MFSFPEHMKRVFKDPEMQRQFEEQGYVIVQFYTPEEIASLNKLYDDLHPQDEKGFYPSTFSQDKNYRQKADEEIRRIGNRPMDSILENQRVVCGSFIVKYPGPESEMCVHQDMTLVDETEFTGINIWCPLVDLTETNGAIYALPKSHRLLPTYRGASVPNIYQDVSEEVIDFMTPLYLKAGEAVIFDQSIIHYSAPNISADKRVVTNTYFTQKEARFRTAYYNAEEDEKRVELFDQPDTFMTDFDQFGENIYDRPKIGTSLGKFDYHFKRLSVADLEKVYGKPTKKASAKTAVDTSRKVPAIFKDSELQKQFDENGYVKVPFINQEQIAELDKLFDEMHPELPDEGFISGSYSSDLVYKQTASNHFKRIFHESYERLFQNYTAFGGSFLFKVPSENSDLVLHQDWTIVDEEKSVAINCWVPLCDTDMNNGTLMVLPRSHYPNYPVHRAPTLDFWFNGNDDLVREKLVPMNAKAGEVVILNQSLIHYSPPNLSGKVRKAITSGIKTKSAPMQFFYSDKEAQNPELDLYSMDENFLIMFDDFGKDIFLPPKHGHKIGSVNYQLPQPSREEVQQLLAKFAGEEMKKPEPVLVEQPNTDARTFWETYTPGNVVREVISRITKS
ncbi:MAG: ectoine hydroxylase-related dioxygenase (phytanoyl-CoA dioxygenase family) [Bacteroidia bacterium]|jgi:ectoine hydroxylase-related dioxygenase (phytanoyl-CoA dioxygenase family)